MQKNILMYPKRAILNLIGRLGYTVCAMPKVYDHSKYATVVPLATYSPWNVDAQFQETYATISEHTLVDLYKLYELWTLVEESAKLSGSIIEVGTWRGGSGALMARQAKLCGISDPVILCDTFSGVVKAGPKDSYVGGEHADTSRGQVEALLAKMGLDNVKILEGIFPEETAHLVPDGPIRLCHVDVDVYESARDVVAWADSRMVIGGMYVYDDFGMAKTAGITELVDEERRRKDRIVIHNLNGHAVVIKVA